MSNEQRVPGLFGVNKGSTPTQLCGDYFKNHEIVRVPTKQPRFDGKYQVKRPAAWWRLFLLVVFLEHVFFCEDFLFASCPVFLWLRKLLDFLGSVCFFPSYMGWQHTLRTIGKWRSQRAPRKPTRQRKTSRHGVLKIALRNRGEAPNCVISSCSWPYQSSTPDIPFAQVPSQTLSVWYIYLHLVDF